MSLGEKIFKLRKEKGFSQEGLAEQIGTTRQAISKWENNQGFPETEKILQLSNIFEVSTDFLLKDDKSIRSTDEKGYYVSREMSEGYLLNEKKTSKYIGIGFMFWALAGIPCLLFSVDTIWRILGVAVCIVIGIVSIVAGAFMEQEQYKVLKQESLIFDYEYLKELSNEYRVKKKKYIAVAIPCIVLFLVGILILVVTVRGYIVWSEYHSIAFLGFAVGLFGLVYSAGVMEAYEILVRNDEYSSKLWFKVKRKLRVKIEKL